LPAILINIIPNISSFNRKIALDSASSAVLVPSLSMTTIPPSDQGEKSRNSILQREGSPNHRQ
jgi:hypothetical protein